MTKVIVSGADGFVGKNLSHQLKKSNIRFLKMGKKFGDISKIETWKKLPKAEVVIHLAGKTFVPDAWKSPKKFYNSNVNGTKSALNFCKKNKAKFIFLSSYMYGNTKKIPSSEKDIIKINNPLAKTKKECEEMCKNYSKKFNLKIIILRPSNVYGPQQKKIWLIPELIRKVKYNKIITVNNTVIKRDLIYVDDLNKAIIKSIFLKKKFTILNIGSGKSFTIKYIIETLQKLLKKKVILKDRKILRKNEILETKYDISKAKRILNWRPIFNLNKGLKKLI